MDAGIDRWMMTFDFTSFSSVLQSYQDTGREIIKDCVLWKRSSPQVGIEPGTAKSAPVAQQAMRWPVDLAVPGSSLEILSNQK